MDQPLWIMFYLAGHLSMVIGPVPYDMEECKHRLEDQKVHLNYNITTDDGYTAKDIKMSCERHRNRPMPEGAVDMYEFNLETK